MKNSIYIFLISTLLISSTFVFGFWYKREITTAFKPLDNSLSEKITYSNTASVSYSISSTTPINFSFLWPKKNSVIYKGCSYKILWMSSTTPNSISISLVDNGTQKENESSVSNLPKNIDISRSKYIIWKIGERIWPGQYFLQTNSIDGKNIREVSYKFEIKEPSSDEDLSNVCEQTI